jgi:hypothetical protein
MHDVSRISGLFDPDMRGSIWDLQVIPGLLRAQLLGGDDGDRVERRARQRAGTAARSYERF